MISSTVLHQITGAWWFQRTSCEAPPCTVYRDDVPSGSSLWTFLSKTSPQLCHSILVDESEVGGPVSVTMGALGEGCLVPSRELSLSKHHVREDGELPGSEKFHDSQHLTPTHPHHLTCTLWAEPLSRTEGRATCICRPCTSCGPFWLGGHGRPSEPPVRVERL